MPAILLQSLRGAGWFSPRKVIGEKALSRCCVAFSRQKEVDRRTAELDSPV
jgi:hypothetical protein